MTRRTIFGLIPLPFLAAQRPVIHNLEDTPREWQYVLVMEDKTGMLTRQIAERIYNENLPTIRRYPEYRIELRHKGKVVRSYQGQYDKPKGQP